MNTITAQDIIEAVGKYRDAFDSASIDDAACFAEVMAREELLDLYRKYEAQCPMCSGNGNIHKHCILR